MSNAITRHEAPSSEALERVLLDADLGSLNATQRLNYYRSTCESLGLNPLTRPFEYLRLNGKTILYATRACTEQLRVLRNVSLELVDKRIEQGVYIVTAKATLPGGRFDTSTGVVAIDGLRGELLANALMKAETKSKRRVTLSICGLAYLDDSEVDAVRSAERVTPDAPTEPARPASAPPPPMLNMGESSALFSAFSAELTQAPDKAAVKAIGLRIKGASDKLHLRESATLRDIARERLKQVPAVAKVQEDSVAGALEGNQLPAAWGGPPEVVEDCTICHKPITGEAGTPTHTNDGEVGFRHAGCSPFGVSEPDGRQPGED